MRWLALASLLSLAIGCGGDVPRSNFYCSYEGRRTSCSSSSYGPWTAECTLVDTEIRDDLTPDTYCALVYPPSDTECAGGCCISFQFRNVTALASCP
ncbi:MAG: hypothetical protein IT378_03275 [Sandaracinaceae bacterium]|nr:hypothetical protein [Sandaracinaceae bacterium]MCC6873306.1 hypothetical protein [Sandaracinaceae bacterium]